MLPRRTDSRRDLEVAPTDISVPPFEGRLADADTFMLALLRVLRRRELMGAHQVVITSPAPAPPSETEDKLPMWSPPAAAQSPLYALA